MSDLCRAMVRLRVRVRVAIPTRSRCSVCSNHKPGRQTVSLKGQILNGFSSVGHTMWGHYSTQPWEC